MARHASYTATMLTLLTASARALVRALERMALPVDAVLASVGLSPEAIEDVEGRLPAAAVDGLWAAAYAVSTDPALALKVPHHLVPADYPVFQYLGRNSVTLGVFIERVVRYFAWVEPRARFEISVTPVGTEIAFQVPGFIGPVHRPAVEFSLAALLLQTRAISGIDWIPTAVRLPFPRPVEGDRHLTLFGPGVRFAQLDAVITVASEDWARPIAGADPMLGAMLETHAAAVVASLPKRGLPDAVRAAAGDLLRDDVEPTIDRIARTLGMSGRSLQRRLRDHGTTLRAELDAERQAQARVLLIDVDVAIAEVAFLLGFSDQSAFTRAFRRWTGESPAVWRAGRTP